MGREPPGHQGGIAGMAKPLVGRLSLTA